MLGGLDTMTSYKTISFSSSYIQKSRQDLQKHSLGLLSFVYDMAIFPFKIGFLSIFLFKPRFLVCDKDQYRIKQKQLKVAVFIIQP